MAIRDEIAEALDLEVIGDDFGKGREEWTESSLTDIPARIEAALDAALGDMPESDYENDWLYWVRGAEERFITALQKGKSE